MGQTPNMQLYDPWTIRQGNKVFQLEDASGFPLFYVPFEDEATLAIAIRSLGGGA
jgi:hypothetical protein